MPVLVCMMTQSPPAVGCVCASQRISRGERAAVDVWQWAWQRVSLPDCGHLVGEQIMRLCVCRLLCEDHHVSVQSATEPGNVKGPWVIRLDGVRVLETRQPKKKGKDMGRFSPFNHIKLDH